MKKISILFLLIFSPFYLFGKSYYSEYIERQKDKQFLVIFYGDVAPEEEPKIKVLERKYLEYEEGDYLEYKHLRLSFEEELNRLGVQVEVIENPDLRFSKKIVPPQPARRREVKCVSRSPSGQIIAIAGDWGIIRVEEAVREINGGIYEYFVASGPKEVRIHVVANRYLRTDPNETPVNNLEFLPECRLN